MNKNEYINYKRCKKAYVLEKLNPELKSDPGENVLNNYKLAESTFLKQFSGIKVVERTEDTISMYNQTITFMDSAKFIANATFIIDDSFMEIDVLEMVNKNTVNIHIVSSKAHSDYTHNIEASFYSALFSLIKIKVNNIYIYTINSKYNREEKLNIKYLFNKEIVSPIISTTEVINDLMEAKKYNFLKDVSFVKINNGCNKHCYADKASACPYFEKCKKELGKNNIFEISGTSITFATKLKWYEKGIVTYKDLVGSGENYDKAKVQVETALYGLPTYINHSKLKEFLDTITFPAYFLDFETFSTTVPFDKNIKPYEQVACQYSLHVLKEKNGPLEHYEHLGKEGTNTKREIAEHLVKDIPRNVCVLAYNMSFEKTQIKAMAEEFPDLRDHLLNICENMKDLMIPFKNKYYYQDEMQGSFSIKLVLPALYPDDEELNYKNLDGVHNGSEAMNAFVEMATMSEEEKEKIRKQLLDYCRLDTLAMVRILEKLYKVIE